jgi:hypothetical protein
MNMGFTNADYADEILRKAYRDGISDKIFDESKKIMDTKEISFYDAVFEAYELVLKEKTFPCLEKQGGGT